MREDAPDVLEMLIRHELVIKQLYELFAVTFTNQRSFWQSLARDEQGHADRLGTLRSQAFPNKWSLLDSLKPQAIKSSIEYVESQIVKAREGGFSLLQALSVARDLESALIEQQFSKLSGSVPKEIRPVMMDLAAETERHLQALVDAIGTLKRLR